MKRFPYRIIERLPAGGAYDVYLAVREHDRLPVVIKALGARYRSDPEALAGLTSEADVLALLDHPNIIRRVDIGSWEGLPFLVLEYLPGIDLRSLIDAWVRLDIDPDLQLTVYVVGEILKALAHVHRARSSDGQPLGLVHRDINPSNVLLAFDGTVKLADFGVAVTAKLDDTSGSLAVGKLAYLAPEQVLSEAVDARTDIYASGAVLYEMSTLCAPYGVDLSDEQKVLEQIVNGQFSAPSKRRRGYPRKLEKLVLKAMARKSTKRYELAEHMAIELAEFRSKGVQAREMLAEQLRHLFAEHFARIQQLYEWVGRDVSKP